MQMLQPSDGLALHHHEHDLDSTDMQMLQPSDGLALRSGQEDDFRKDSVEQDEKRLAELGRKTVEMLVISHIITEKIEVVVCVCHHGWMDG
jgi:hypothetical protein